MHFAIPVFAACALLASAGSAAERVAVGDTIPNLTFKDIHYLPRSLDQFGKKNAFVLVFTNTTCPLVQRYLPVLQAMEKEYRDKGVQFVAVNCGPEDSIVAMAVQAVEFGIAFPFVKDFDGKCGEALGVTRTPEVVVLDGERRLRYRGRIDDQYRLGGTRPAATRNDLREALNEVLAGKEVSVKETPVDGCLITKAEPPRVAKNVTFAEHAAPLMKKHCQECHRGGTSAPFSLTTYKQVAGKAATIAEVISEGRMPPWFGSTEHAKIINRRALSSEERDTILAWIKAGTPLGDEKKLPEPLPPLKSKWLIGKPDLIVPGPEHELPATGDIAYKYIILPHVFLEDTWVQGVQILPDNPRIVHHCNMAWVTLAEGFKASNFITGFVPGNGPMTMEEGVGFKIPTGATLGLQIHFVTTGKPEKCRISVGLKYASGVVQKQLKHFLLVDTRFAIPPGEPAHAVSASRTLTHDAVGVGFFSHMHVRGKDMTFKAHYPDGKSETLLIIPNYSFDWQVPYRLEPNKVQFPKGTRFECIAHYDNSAFNPFNPNPKATVKDGPQTYNEMMNGFVFFTDANEKLNLDIEPKTGHVRTKEKSTR
jgi:thiol-disulfide isomerase/thioredoxin